MGLMPHVDAVLVFDASEADDTGEYAMYSIRPENELFLHGEWEDMKAALQPTGRFPVAEVKRDEAKHQIRILTYGIERFATTS